MSDQLSRKIQADRRERVQYEKVIILSALKGRDVHLCFMHRPSTNLTNGIFLKNTRLRADFQLLPASEASVKPRQ